MSSWPDCQHDLATTRYLLERETFDGPITEPCSGDGMIVEVLHEWGYEVVASDLREAGVVGTGGVNLHDLDRAVNVVTNPPYTDLGRHVEHLVRIAEKKVACLLPLRFNGSQGRRGFFLDTPPTRIYSLPKRPTFFIGGRDGRKQSPAWDYGWFVWDRAHGGATEMIYE